MTLLRVTRCSVADMVPELSDSRRRALSSTHSHGMPLVFCSSLLPYLKRIILFSFVFLKSTPAFHVLWAVISFPSCRFWGVGVGLVVSLGMKPETGSGPPVSCRHFTAGILCCIFSFHLTTFVSDGKVYSFFFFNDFLKNVRVGGCGWKNRQGEGKRSLFFSLVSFKNLFFTLFLTFWLSNFSLVSGFALSLFIL